MNTDQSLPRSIQRRQFLKSSAFLGAAGLLLPRFKLFGADAPSNKLNIALIAIGHRAKDHFDIMSRENVVAICDINEKHLASAAKKFPKAKHYADWRKCLEQKDIDAIVCCTLDHTHAFVTNWAMNRGKHVYCEKPLVNSVEEARLIRATWLKNKDKLATQVGTQRHRVQEFQPRARIDPRRRHRRIAGSQRLGQPPGPPRRLSALRRRAAQLYQLRSVARPRAVSSLQLRILHAAAACKWDMHWDFGSGQVGDMGSHTMDLAWNAIDASLPTSAEGKGDPFNPEVTPVKLETQFELPANDWRPPIIVSWHQGGAMPDSPNRAIDLTKIDHGVMFEGSKGYLVADFTSRILIPQNNDTNHEEANMTYYKPRPKDQIIPAMGIFQQEWINACKGDLKTSCNFGYATDMIEMMLLGLVAYRAGKKIKYDGATGHVTDCPEANQYLRHTYREGWTLNG